MTKKLILLNAPPRCGKDTSVGIITEHLKQYSRTVVGHKFAAPLKNGTHSFFGLEGVGIDHYEDSKGEPKPELFGLTPREAYIKFSEECIKPVFGKDYFGRIASKSIQRLLLDTSDVVVVSDFGFLEEFIPLLADIPSHQMISIQLEREGIGYEGDSRSYVDVSRHIDQVRVVSNTIEELEINIKKIMDDIYGVPSEVFVQ